MNTNANAKPFAGCINVIKSKHIKFSSYFFLIINPRLTSSSESGMVYHSPLKIAPQLAQLGSNKFVAIEITVKAILEIT